MAAEGAALGFEIGDWRALSGISQRAAAVIRDWPRGSQPSPRVRGTPSSRECCARVRGPSPPGDHTANGRARTKYVENDI